MIGGHRLENDGEREEFSRPDRRGVLFCIAAGTNRRPAPLIRMYEARWRASSGAGTDAFMIDDYRFGTLVAVATALLGSAPASATTFYVSADRGTDQASSGLARETPLHGLAAATARLQPGDRLVIESGVYTEPLHLVKSGTAAAPIEVMGDEGELPQIRTAEDAVTIAADYVVVLRLDASSSGDLGSAFLIMAGHHHVTIADSVAHDSACVGIGGLQTDHVVIRHNRVYGNSGRSPWQCSGISLYQAANIDDAPGFHNVISGNLVYGNMNRVLDPKLTGPLAGHTTDGNGIIIDDFRHTQPWQGQRTAPYRSATLVENNVVYGNGGRGIEVFYSDDVTLIGNTAIGDLLDRQLIPGTYGELHVAFASRVKLYNNLIDSGAMAAVTVAKADNVEADYNVTVGGGLRQDGAAVAWGGHNQVVPTAGFVDEKSRNLHLAAGSPALGRGSAAHASTIDLDGRRRTGAIDVGAYQFSR